MKGNELNLTLTLLIMAQKMFMCISGHRNNDVMDIRIQNATEQLSFGESQYREQSIFDIFLDFGVPSFAAAAMLSQMMVMMISVGLEGNYSAQTTMMVQALAEIVKHFNTIQASLCPRFDKFF